MKQRLFLILLAAIGTAFVQAQSPKIKAVKIGSHIDVTVGDKFFTSYRFSSDEKYPFFFPVNGPLSNAAVTSMRNAVYPHHTSLWFGCDRVNGGNYWQETLDRGQILSMVGAQIVEQGETKVVIEDECIWKRPGVEAPIKDRRLITITSPRKDIYQIDFDITMDMLMDVTIIKTNHSLFSARVDADLSVAQGGVMQNAEGAKGEKGTFGVPSPWLDFYGTRKSGVEGLAVLQHPSNMWYPSPWFTRDYGFMSPTPMYWPSNDKESTFKKGDTLKLRYRVLVHGGTTEEAGIDKLFEQYKKE